MRSKRAQPERPVGCNFGVGFRFDGLEFWVDLGAGARVTTFALEGFNLLVEKDVDPDLYGSTFWTAPQVDWGWPPVAELDALPYAPTIADDHFVLTSRPSPLGITVAKTYRALPQRQAVEIQYTIENVGKAGVKVAPWEVTRARGGLSFFAGRMRATFHRPETPPIALVEQSSILWQPYDAAQISCDQKSYCHADEGWLAHVDRGVLFLKSFPVVPEDQAAPGEALIEVYARADHAYIELENTGAYRALAPGDVYSWTVRWFLRKLPGDLDVRLGEQRLVDFARSLV